MSISAASIKELRTATGAGIADCKKALQEAEGDFDKAVENLRKKGLAAAKKKAGRIKGLGAATHHLVLTSVHPSPLSAHAGFFGSRPFSQTNAFLEAQGCDVIDWAL